MFQTFARLFINSLLLGLMGLPAATLVIQGQTLPAGNQEAPQRLENSTRRREVVQIKTESGATLTAVVVYPEGSGPAPVVVAIHGRGGWNLWVQALADQLAADGFLAIAPDMGSGQGPGGSGTESLEADDAAKLVYSLTQEQVMERVSAVADYAIALPEARPRFAVVGFCWGGTTSFAYAGQRPDLGAAVVYYGSSPSAQVLARINAPVLGLYGGDDARVNVSIEPADVEMKRLGKAYQYEIYAGAGHAFLAGQGRSEANSAATARAWPRTIQFLNEHLGQ
jgi:carboxymethylenebutenolidase